jgi:fermentation-respiration switch protein FrsA (DUF1100 family)
VLITLVVIYVAWLTLIYVAQDAILFPRWMANPRYEPAPAGVECWTLDHKDGVRTEAWFVPARSASSTAHPLVVLLHGNAMLVQDWEEWADALARDGWNVLIPEFRGYGVSGGKPKRAALVDDMIEAIERAKADPRVDAKHVAIYGRSVGGAIAAEAAATLSAPPEVLVLQTTPACIADFSWRYGAPRFLVRCPFDAESAVKELKGRCSITVIGHRQDEIVPFSHAQRLAKAAGVDLIAVDGTHNDSVKAADMAIEAALEKARK